MVYADIATVPEVPATGDSGYPSVTALLYFDGSNGSTTITDSSTLASNWVTTGANATLDTSEKKFGTASLNLAAGSYVRSSAAGSNFSFGTSAWTIEFWVRHPAINGAILSASAGTTLSIECLFNFPSSSFYRFTTPVGTVTSADLTFSNLGVWNHIALCRSGSSTKLFLNGTQIGTTQTDNTNYSSTEFQIGDSNFSGRVDELRITKGVARYTSNFTAPTASFDGFYTPGTPAVAPQLTLPQVNTNMYRVWNLNAESLSVKPQTGESIDGATGGVTMAQNDTRLFLSNGASGWRSW